MRRVLTVLLVSLTCCFLGSLLPAQSVTRTIPAFAEQAEGNSSTDVFNSGMLGRVQQIVAASAVASAQGQITEIRLRPDYWAFPLNQAQIPHLQVTVGMTVVTPAGMSQDFAANRLGPRTVVHSGPYQMPDALKNLSQPRKFDHCWKFSQPVVFIPQVGNLLVEWEWTGWTGNVQDRFDLHNSSSGSSTPVGSFGGFSSPGTPQMVVDTTKLRPGGKLDVQALGLAQAYPALACFGFSDTRWGSLPLPMSLRPLGAPNEVLWNSVDFVLPCSSSGGPGLYRSSVQFPIPNSPQLDLLRFFVQFAFVDLPANAAGLVLSPSCKLELPKTGLFSSVWSGSLTATSGWLLKDGGLVLQVVGQLP